MPYKSFYQEAFVYATIGFLTAKAVDKMLQIETDIDYNSSRLEEIDEKIDELSSRLEKKHESSELKK